SERDLHARNEIRLQASIRKIQIEGRVWGDFAQNDIIPTALTYQTSLSDNAKELKEIGLDKKKYQRQLDINEKISAHVNLVKQNVDAMTEERKKANKLTDVRKMAAAYDQKVKPYFEVIRYNIEKLERMVDDSVWPMPKYRELLFLR